MRRASMILLAWLAHALVVPPAAAQSAEGESDPLVTVLRIDAVAIGIATTSSGRTFLPLSRIDGRSGPQAVEWLNGKAVAFPDARWNSWKAGSDPADAFVRVNSLRIGPDGALWIVDVGTPTLEAPVLAHGPKIVKIDLAANKVVRVYPLDGATKPNSLVDDIRFNGPFAYITDAGSVGVIVLDLASGVARRVLDSDPTITAQRVQAADDHVLRGPNGKAVQVHADQLEVSPDGRFFYYQPASGPMARIATRYLNDPKLTGTQMSKYVTTFAKTTSTAGTAIDVEGNIYCSDVDKHSIVKVRPDGVSTTLISDPRLIWVDGMWIDAAGYLFLPAAQLDRMAPFNDGVDKVQYPVTVYKMKIGAQPPALDHP